MLPFQRRQLPSLWLFGAALLAFWLYLSGLASTLQLGDASIQGFLLVPTLPTPFYIIMAVVVVSGVGLTLLVSFLHRRRRRPPPEPERQEEETKTPLQVLVMTLASLALLAFVLVWLMRHGSEIQHLFERLRFEVGQLHEWLENAQLLVQQVPSSTTGYALFTIVLVVYGGLALLALWVLLEDRHSGRLRPQVFEDAQTRQVRQAVKAGLRELQEHADPRQAIIACYAQLEHLLEDYGVPAAQHLTPQEYMSTALRGLELPLETFAHLVALFELARYSLHPLQATDRAAAITHLKRLQSHLEGESGYAIPV
jgi:hypothetical protein